MFNDLLIHTLAAILIGVVSAIAGFISRYWIEALIRGKFSDYVSVLPGTWTGIINQHKGVIGSNEVVFELKTFLNVVYGKMVYKDKKETLKFVGGFVQDRYLNMHYKNTHNTILQYGSVLLHLSGTNQILSGDFLGVGPESEKIVRGSVKLKK